MSTGRGQRKQAGTPGANRWKSKDERQFEHVKSIETKRGRPPKVAARVAAAVVKVTRRRQGRTARSTAENPRWKSGDLTKRAR